MTSMETAPQTLKLPEILDLNAASRLHEQILALDRIDTAVDASDVSRVGAQCVQVLLSAMRGWKADGLAFVIDDASESFVKTLQLLGISDEMSVSKEMVK